MESKDVYETLDVIEAVINDSTGNALPGGVLAELLMALTGTEMAETGPMVGIPAHNPDASAEARKTVLRWLGDHGYIPKPDPRRVYRDNEPQSWEPCGHQTGMNRTCQMAYRLGRPAHVIPPPVDVRKHDALVMPTYHYRTVAEGVATIKSAIETAPTVETDADLYRYRKQMVPHFLPVGWVDPSRR